MKKLIRFLALVLVALLISIALTSCGEPNSDPDKALDSLRANGLPLSMKLDRKSYNYNGLECVVSGIGTIDGEGACIAIFYFESSKDASDAMDEIKKMQDEDEYKDFEDVVCKRSNRMVYIGTKNAVKAAK